MSKQESWTKGRRGMESMVFVAFLLGAACLLQAGVSADLQFEAAELFSMSEMWMSGGWHGPSLASDGNGHCVLAWFATDSLGGTIGTDGDIIVSLSDDYGATWSDPAPLNTNAYTDNGTDARVCVVTDGNGTWVAAWDSVNDLGMGIGTDWDILYARSYDNGATWTDPRPLNPDAAKDRAKDLDMYVRLATDGAGRWIAAWSKSDVSWIGTRIARAVDPGPGGSFVWTGNTSFPATGPIHPRVVFSPGNLYAPARWLVVAYYRGSYIQTSSSTDDGLTWSQWQSAIAVGEYECAGHPEIAADANGNLVLVVDTCTPEYTKTSRSTDAGATWSPLAPLNPDPGPGSEWSGFVATDNEGSWVAVWCKSLGLAGILGTDPDILCSLSTDVGLTWSAPKPVNSDAYVDTRRDEGPAQVVWNGLHWVSTWPAYQAAPGPELVFVGLGHDSPISVEVEDGLYTTEDRGCATFRVALEEPPSAGEVVAVAIESGDTSEGTVFPDTLTFDATNWGDRQVVAATGVDDNVIDGDTLYTVSLVANSTDPESAFNDTRNVTLANRDNDAPTQIRVSLIYHYYANGGKDLWIKVGVENEVGTPVAGAAVAADLYRNGVKVTSFTGTTNASGVNSFEYRNAKSGTYLFRVTGLSYPGLTWVGGLTELSFTK